MKHLRHTWDIKTSQQVQAHPASDPRTHCGCRPPRALRSEAAPPRHGDRLRNGRLEAPPARGFVLFQEICLDPNSTGWHVCRYVMHKTRIRRRSSFCRAILRQPGGLKTSEASHAAASHIKCGAKQKQGHAVAGGPVDFGRQIVHLSHEYGHY